MKKSQVDIMFIDQTKRRNKIISYSILIFIGFILSLSFLLIFLSKNRSYSVSYTEDGNIDYNVYLKQNNFFENEYLNSDNQYIASLIDYVDAYFKYKISMENMEVNYKYSYAIEVIVDVKESNTSKSLYNTTRVLKKVENQNATGNNNLIISENLKIDYNDYNDMIKKFVSLYGLEDVVSTLTINMHVSVLGSCDDFSENSNNEHVLSLVIPLTTKTVGIDIKNDIIDQNEVIMICNDSNSFTVIYLMVSITLLLVILLLLYKLIKYIINTRSAQTIYDKELKKILNYYHSYIQKISNKLDLHNNYNIKIDSKFIYDDCQVFKLESFNDMLEIRDSIHAPIFMSSNEQNTATYFVILDVNNRAIYIYGLSVTSIKKQIKNGETNKI